MDLGNNLSPAMSPPIGTTPIGSPSVIPISPIGVPAMIFPQPFDIADPSLKEAFEDLRSEIVDKSVQWENRMTPMFGEYEEYTNNWRVQSTRAKNMPKGLFNSKSGETHRSIETLTSKEFMQLVSNPDFFYAVGEGLDDWGREASEVELQAVEQTIRKQLSKIRFEEKLERGIRSKKTFGTIIAECPWTSFPYGDGDKSFEGTDFIPRSLLTTGFNPFVFDLDQSDYLFTIDFPTIVMIRNWARNSSKDWNIQAVEKIYLENPKGSSVQGTSRTTTYSRVTNRKQRAGYNVLEKDVWELLTYHGRIDTDNDAVMRYWEANQRQDDPSLCDWTAGIMEEEGVVRFHPTPFRSWHHLFKTAHEKLFELEPLGYSAAKIGRKRQKELDALESRTNDLVMFNVLPMWKIGKYAGVDVSKLTIKPWSFVELENIDQLQPIQANVNAIPYSLNMQGLWKEDFRSMTGATASLQGTSGGGSSATENVIIQNESQSAVEIRARITASVFLKDFIETCHINNTYLMDNGFWVKTMQSPRPIYINKDNLPFNVGFMLKMAANEGDKQREISNALQALQMATSFRNSPTALNVVEPLWQKVFRLLGEDTRLLTKPVPMPQQMLQNVQAQANQVSRGGQATAPQSMQEGAAAGGGTPPGGFNSPVGQVMTSPVQMPARMS